jgi:hypothetical protein
METAGGKERKGGTGRKGKDKTFLATRDLPVFGLLLALAVIFLLPGSLRPAAAPLGYPGDTFQHAWFLWHFARSVSHGLNPFVTDLIFYPHRVNLAWSTTDPIASVMALPFNLAGAPILAYNLSLILQLALGGFFAYLMYLRICCNPVAAAIGGICFGFSPFLVGEALGHLSLVTTFPIPLYFLALDSMLRRADGGWTAGILPGLALFLTAMAHYNFTVFCILLTVVIVSVDLLFEGAALAKRIWRPMAAGTVLFALLFLPFFLSMWREPAARPRSRSLDLIEGHSADLLGWFVPSWNHLLFGRAAQNWNPGLFSAGYEGVVYLGPVILILAAFGIVVGLRSKRRWAVRLLVAAIIFDALSLGPHIRIWGRQTHIPGPGLLFYLSPFGRFVSAPARFHAIAMLCLAAFVSIAVASILSSLRSTKARIAVVVLICIALALDLPTLPFPVATAAASEQHRGFAVRTDGCSLPADLNGSTVLTVPELEWPYPVRASWMQLNDGGRYALADGYVSYGPDSIWDDFWSQPLLRSLRAVQAGHGEPLGVAAVRASLPQTVQALNLGAIVVYDFPQSNATIAYLQNALDQQPQKQDTCAVFDLAHPNAEASSARTVSPGGQSPLY